MAQETYDELDDELYDDEEEGQEDEVEYEDDDEGEDGDDTIDDDSDDGDDDVLDDGVWEDDIDEDEEDEEEYMEGEELDEDDETEEDEEDEEERSMLDDLLEEDPNAEPEDDEEELEYDPEEDPEITDEMIADAAWKDSSWAEYMEQADADGVQPNDKFVALMARGRISPEFLTERGLYNMRDFQDYITSMEEKTNPDAVLVPREDDLEGWEYFDKEILGVPDEYDSDIFDQTFMEGNDEKIKAISDEMHEGRFSNAQAMIFTNMVQREREEFLRAAEEEEIAYKKQTTAFLKETFGSDYDDVRKDAVTFIKKYSPDIFKNHKGSKLLNSPEIVMLAYNAMNDVATPETVKFKDSHIKLSTISDDKLDKIYKDLLNHKYSDNDFQNHENSRIRNQAKKVAARLNAVDKERVRRGLVE